MKFKNIENYLESFAKNVVQDSKKALSNNKGQTELENSIRATVKPTAQGFSVKFYMYNYGKYLDEGVSGNKNTVSFTNIKGAKQISSFKYTKKGPPIDILSKWIKKKGIKPKGLGKGRSKKTGQFISGFAYLISKKIKREGIKSISFFQKPLGILYKQLQNDFLKMVKLDIQAYLVTYTQK